jgi:hypothetical protein
MQLAREQSAREALAIEVARLRGAAPSLAAPPTLTLAPLTARGASPPPPTVAPPDPAQIVALRLVLPDGADTRGPFSIAIRGWSGGETLLMRGHLPATSDAGRRMVVAMIAGDVLARGAYEVILTVPGADGRRADVASYELTVG